MHQVSFKNIIIVFISGCFGGAARYGVSLLLNDGSTMWGTTAVNLLGCLALTIFTYGFAEHFDLSAELVLAIGTGLIGSFTTLSTLLFEAVMLFASRPWYVFVALIINLFGGLLAVAAGMRLGRHLFKGWSAW